MNINIVTSLSDNYIYIISYNKHCIVIDPGEASPVKKFIEKENLSLTAILLTHYHQDHIGGVEELDCTNIIGPKENIDSVEIGPCKFEILKTPGHTKDHISFYEPNLKALFCGDVLFGGGCGRVFDGTNEQMWESLKLLRSLPSDTKVYFGHEYTKSNLQFAKTLLPKDKEIVKRFDNLQPVTTPSTIDLEKKSNIFLRADDLETMDALGMPKASPQEVFTYLRDLKSSS